MVRFICHFLIVWMTLLAGGAHAVADARHEASHAVADAVAMLTENAHTSPSALAHAAPGADELQASQGQAHSENCSHSHCGHSHATGMLPTLQTTLPDTARDMALSRQALWSSGKFANNIERPKWSLSTPAVVNL